MIPLSDGPIFNNDPVVLSCFELHDDLSLGFNEGETAISSDVESEFSYEPNKESNDKCFWGASSGSSNFYVHEDYGKYLFRDCPIARADSVLTDGKNSGVNLHECVDYEFMKEAEMTPVSPQEVYHEVVSYGPKTNEIPPYTPDSDHCYSKTNISKIFTSSPDPENEASEDEVDVVTVPEEYNTPLKKSPPRRNARYQKYSKKAQHIVASRNLKKASMKRTGNSAPRKTYKRRKINYTECRPFSPIQLDDEDYGKRANHNTSERKRREVQRDALQKLRCCIPDLTNKPKAPKVQILQRAKLYIKELERESYEEVLKKNKKLIAKLNKLKKEEEQYKRSHTQNILN